MFQTKVVEVIKTHTLCSGTFFFENRAACGKKWKNIVQRADHRWQYGACALHDG
jgi:hypothetical protein